MGNNQTYDNYFKDYYKTPKGRIAKRKAQNRYRAKLRAKAAESERKGPKTPKDFDKLVETLKDA